MKFNPNYKTKDGWFEVELDLSKLTNEKPPKQDYWQSDEITVHKIRVYNTHTNRFSEKAIYRDNKGYYFKGSNSYWHRTPSSKYYVKELVKVVKMSKDLESVALGAKVLCKGYLKKNHNFITNEEDIQKDLCKLNNKPFTDSESGYLDGLGNEVDWEEQIKVREFVDKEFTGFVCGKKNLHTTIYPTVFYQDFTGTEYNVICKDNYVLCYEVCVENKNKSWGKRYVPVDKVEVITQ